MKNYILVLAVAFSLTACEKKVEVDSPAPASQPTHRAITIDFSGTGDTLVGCMFYITPRAGDRCYASSMYGGNDACRDSAWLNGVYVHLMPCPTAVLVTPKHFEPQRIPKEFYLPVGSIVYLNFSYRFSTGSGNDTITVKSDGMTLYETPGDSLNPWNGHIEIN
jgi:hypothetical protein